MAEDFSLPDGWTCTTLGKLSNYINGRAFKPSEWGSIGRPIIRIQNLTGSTETVNYYSGDVENRHIIRNGDLLISWSATLGVFIYQGEEAVLNQHIFKAEPFVNKKFLYYLIMAFLDTLKMQVHGSGMQHITKGKFDNSPVPLPPEVEQERIVAKIEELFTQLDAGTAALQRVQVGLKRYKMSVFKSMCGGTYVGEKFGNCDLPKGWKRTTFDEVIESLDNMRVPVNKKEREGRQGHYPYYGANGQVDWIDDYIFDEPLVLVVEDETFTGREKPFSYKIKGKTWVNNHAHVLRPRVNILDVDYLNYSLAYYPFIPMTTGTTGRKKLIKSVLMAAEYVLPPLFEQRQIVADIERQLSIVNELEVVVLENLKRATRLRQTILKQAFKGSLVAQNTDK